MKDARVEWREMRGAFVSGNHFSTATPDRASSKHSTAPFRHRAVAERRWGPRGARMAALRLIRKE